MRSSLTGILFIIFYFQDRIVADIPNSEESKLPDSVEKASPSLNNVDMNSLKSIECKDIEPIYVKCEFNTSCVYGELNTVNCHVDSEFSCRGDHSFVKTFPCLYCWQLPEDSFDCFLNTSCKVNTRYLTKCNVNSTTYCLGRREFSKYTTCKTVAGHKWSVALVLSILFGGFGVDRFYLGHWQEGVGKLFSFGGFGIWTLIDTILISIGYLKPADVQYEQN